MSRLSLLLLAVLVLSAASGPAVAQCFDSWQCPPGSYCAKPDGQCNGPGTCAPRPSYCLQIWDPVCGCDGQTYGNACDAAQAGVSVAYPGPCGSNGCYNNAVCGPTTYCAKAAGNCDGVGQCQPRPTACPDLWDPVCGCDGNTYGNECEAAAAGVNVAHAGECPPAPCLDNAECAPDAYCAKATGDCDGAGVCTPRPGGCPAVWLPVCGCDGNTYGNECEAAVAGVNVDYEGPCGTPCTDNQACDADHYCRKEPGDCAGQGVCTSRPTVCPDLWDPVCGCDGLTYGNECEAASVGVSVYQSGPCPANLCSDNEACGADHYCSRPEGHCGGFGRCTPRPEICPHECQPVCGCDGVTYANACNAAKAGVGILHAGYCMPMPGDFDADLDVDPADEVHFLQHWLEQNCGYPGWCAQVDLDYSGRVDLADFTLFVHHWMLSP